MDREQLITSLCMTWRHDYGLDKHVDTVLPSSGMTSDERAALRARMGQLFDHHIAPLLAQIPRWRQPDEELPELKPQEGWHDASEEVLVLMANQKQVVGKLIYNPYKREPSWCDTFGACFEGDEDGGEDEVIAWMPLPAALKVAGHV